jgi:hypothetical protein
MSLMHGKSKKAFEHNVKTEMDAHPDQRAQNLAIAYAIKRRNQMAKGGIAASCPDCYAHGGKCMAHGGEATPVETPDMHMMSLGEPKVSGKSSGSPSMDMAVRGKGMDMMSLTERIMKRRGMEQGHIDRDKPEMMAQGGWVDSSDDDFDEMHDYSMLPEGHDAQTMPGETHDSDMPDEAQDDSLVGQIMKKRRMLKPR